MPNVTFRQLVTPVNRPLVPTSDDIVAQLKETIRQSVFEICVSVLEEYQHQQLLRQRRSHTPEARRRISEAQRLRWANMSPDQRATQLRNLKNHQSL